VQAIHSSPPRRSRYLAVAPDQLTLALAGLDGWHGDTHRIRRTVHPADLWDLLERVAATEAELNHHTLVDLDAGTLTFTVWTHTCDAVTDADLELARRINAIIDSQ
jgi:4a-hydroxytetrahydrobiopterin dehydratase